MQAANFEFYEKLESSCCGQLEHYRMPVFVAGTEDVKAGHSPALTLKKDVSKVDLVQGLSTLSLALSLSELYLYTY